MTHKRTRNTRDSETIARKSEEQKAPVINVELIVLANEEPPMAEMLLKNLYNAAFQARIGLMYAKNEETGEINPLIVGLDTDGDNFTCFPLAKIMNSDEAMKYLAPDRMGGWQPMLAPSDEGYEITAEELEEARKSLEKSTD